MDYEVDYAQLDRAGQKADGLASDVAATLTGMRLDDVPAAVPGGMTAGAASHVDGQWVESTQQISEALTGYARRMAETAVAYRKIEDTAATAANDFFGAI